jgi:hypothetical protein
MKVKNELDNTDEIFIGIGEKILNIILFWIRFRLSLAGRVAITKTLQISQIDYLGCFLTPSRAVLDDLQRSLDEFVLNSLPCVIAKRFGYLPPDKGELPVELIHVGTFLLALKCSWVKRAHENMIDNWRFSLKLLSPNLDLSHCIYQM